MNRLQVGYYLLRYFGPRIALLRANVYWRKWRGTARRQFASRPWDSLLPSGLIRQPGPGGDFGDNWAAYATWKQAHLPPFLFPLGQPPQVVSLDEHHAPRRTPHWQTRLEKIQHGYCFYFCDYLSPEPIEWYRNPFDGSQSDHAAIWCDIPDYRPSQGDPRWLWEPARAGWAFELARAAARGEQDLARQVFWQWCHSWMDACPPFHGFHWKCGQEAAVRLIALTMGMWATTDPHTPNPDAWRDLARLAWATAYRIEHHIEYAISQKNNHAISEATGLILVSHLFPEFNDAPRWRALGEKVLIQELRRQIYPDGSYVQHSMNYQRVMLQGALLAARILELQQQPLPPDIYQRLGQSADFLMQMHDEVSGQVPQYGNNDGAYIMPWSDCRFWDFRPVIQAATYLVERQPRFPPGPWDEDAHWLFGSEFVHAPASQRADTSLASRPTAQTNLRSTAFSDGGYYTLRRSQSWCFVRCHTFKDRPAHYDQLHVDLWWQGINLLRDCGTHRYYMPDRPDVEKYFKSIRAHNTIEIDGSGPLESVSRFLWLPWPRGRVEAFAPDATIPYWEARHFDYERRPWQIRHRRTVLGITPHSWLVVDDVIRIGAAVAGQRPATAQLRWQLAQGDWQASEPHTFQLGTPAGVATLRLFTRSTTAPDALHTELLCGKDVPGEVEGYASPSYGQRIPIPVAITTFAVQSVRRVLTLISLGEAIDVRPLSDPADSAAGDGPAGKDSTGAVARSSAGRDPHSDLSLDRWSVQAAGEPFTLALGAPTAARVAPQSIGR